MVDNCVPRQQLGSCSVTRPFFSLRRVWLARLSRALVLFLVALFSGSSPVQASPQLRLLPSSCHRPRLPIQDIHIPEHHPVVHWLVSQSGVYLTLHFHGNQSHAQNNILMSYFCMSHRMMRWLWIFWSLYRAYPMSLDSLQVAKSVWITVLKIEQPVTLIRRSF